MFANFTFYLTVNAIAIVYGRFGTHVSGVAPVTRQMRINNSGPVGEYMNSAKVTLLE